MNPELSPRRNPEKAIARIESFSDAIFGFAITLLVLDLLQIPRPEIGQNLTQAFVAHWQSFFAFLIGFFTVLVCWINHHHLFCYIVQYEGKFIWINGILLLIVTFIPFPTALFANFLLEENGIGLILFGLTYFLVAFVADLMWTYAHKNKLLSDQENDSYYRSIRLVFRFGLFYALVAFLVCFISNTVAMVLYFVLFAVFAFPHYFALQLQHALNGREKHS